MMFKNKELISKILFYLGMFFTFLILDVGMRYLLWEKINFVSVKSYSPLAFSISYVCILLIIMFIFPKRAKFIYIISTILANIYFLAQMIHFNIFNNLFSLISLFSVGEATDYLGYALSNARIDALLVILLSITSLVVVLIIIKKNKITFKVESKKIIKLFLIIFIIILLRVSAMYKLGKSVSNDAWNAWKVPRNVYNNYSNSNYSLMVSGMYEYIFRDAYLYVRNIVVKDDKKVIMEVDEYMDSLDIENISNEYSGIFKDKNLIVIMLESIDNWLVTKDVMPTMYKLSKEGLNFTNRYAPFFGNGMTINSEFASISGLYGITKDKAIYNYNYNNFDYSMPSMFKKNGYTVNSMHMNDGVFYNRRNFHIGLGFENHYPLYEMGFNENFNYDTNIVKNDNSYNLIINKGDNKPFLTFITTYSAHVPYLDNPMCNDLEETSLIKLDNDGEELSCIKLLANETDNFIKLLIERLDKDNYLDDTVLVLFADHYIYGYTDVKNTKETSDVNLIQKTPFIIWSKDIKHKDIDKMVDTADIPLTIFNMFSIDYNPKLYMGTDIFSNYHENFVYFSDYSWYDGEYYSKNNIENDYTKRISEIVNKKISINTKIISSNYYKYYK